MSDTRIQDRRRNKRYAVDLPIEMDGCRGRLRDLSTIGALIETDVALEELSMLEFAFSLNCDDDTVLELSGQAAVVRTKPLENGQHEAGLFFTYLSDEARGQIERFLASIRN